MKKILFLISLTLLTFSNTASGGFFGDVFKTVFGDSFKKSSTEYKGNANNARCKVEYTQLDLNTGIETLVKYTVQFQISWIANGQNACYLSAQYSTDKINNWLDESKGNVITNMTVINCKERSLYGSKIFFLESEQRWGEYKSCADEFNMDLFGLLDHPKQWGYNVHKDRLIKDYKEGFKNYYGE
jgi:hypothetical protein